MKVLVCAKRVVDANIKVRVKSDETNVDIEHSKRSMNPFDEVAIEEAVKLKKIGKVTEIIAVIIGSEKTHEIGRLALARGADRLIWVKSPDEVESINIAKILSKIVQRENIDVVLLGKQSIDSDNGQTAQMMSGILNYPLGFGVTEIDIENNRIVIKQDIESGFQKLSLSVPAVISVDLELNKPSFIKLPQLMMAKKKIIENILLEDLGLVLKSHSRIIKAIDGDKKTQCVKLTSVDDLITKINEVI